MKWISAGDIQNWANTKKRHCQQTLPELVRRLILATVNTVDEIDFPSGDSVAHGGWDGRLKTHLPSAFFPSGTSGWEIGTETSPGKKADADYKKRTKNSFGLNKKETSFVFVTPRPFPKRTEWQSGKKSKKAWKDIRVISADTLEQWLDLTPAVALWLARKIEKGISGNIRDLENVWEWWALAPQPPMTIELVISGRLNEVGRIHQWLAQPANVLEVQGDRPDEVFAFLYAAISGLPEIDRVRALSRCVVVEDANQFKELVQAFQSPLIIVAPSQCAEIARVAVTKGHHVFIALDSTVVAIRDSLRLSRPQRNVVEKALHQMGLSETEAEKTARDSGRSIPVLYRHLLLRSGVAAMPTWASAEAAQVLIPTFLANAWDERSADDCKAIEQLAGMKYEKFIEKLQPFLSIDDAPIRKVGTVWMVKSPLDTWFLLASHVTSERLKLFEKVALTIFKKIDPKYDLAPDKRFAAAVYGKANPHSEWLRVGLAESLTLIAVFGNRAPNSIDTQALADRVVRKVLDAAKKWEAWSSMKDISPLLAEASPIAFLNAVEQTSSKNPEIFRELMKDGGGMFGEYHHTGLLWALEGIVWSPDYFSRAVDALAGLANIDPGGRVSNRAINSLSDVFLPGFPQTYAEPVQRIAALRKLVKTFPKMVWEFAQAYYSSGTFSESHRLRWRDATGNRRGLEPEDDEKQREYFSDFLPLLEDLAVTKENLLSTVREFIRLPEAVKQKLLDTLQKMDSTVLSKEERIQLLVGVREVLHWINSYGDEYPRKYLVDLNSILKKFEPENVLDRLGWLLQTPWPHLPEGEPKEYDSRDTAIKEAQQKAARRILDETSLSDIMKFAEKLEYPGVFGYSIAKIIKDQKEDVAVLGALLSKIKSIPIVLRGYVSGRIENEGVKWLDVSIKRLQTQKKLSVEASALLYLGLPEGDATWRAVAKQGKKVELAYWKRARGYSQINKEKDIPFAIEKLLDAGRPVVALNLVSDPKISVPSSLLKRLLQEIVRVDSKKLRADGLDDFHLGHVFNQLYEKNELSLVEMAGLEWPFAALLKNLRQYTTAPSALHRILQTDPQFFAQLIAYKYKRDDNKLDPADKGVDKKVKEIRWRATSEVLDSWYLIPGMNDGGEIDESALTDWVIAARKRCLETHHVMGGDLQIAYLLGHAPADTEGIWPCVPVRNVIEALSNDIIDEHIAVEIRNSRGVVSRGLSEGGVQERNLAEKYKQMSDVVQSRWPRTGAILRSLADSYTREASGEDVDSELRDLRWN